MYPTNTVLFAVTKDDNAKSDAMAYIRRYKLTSDDVKMGETETAILITAKRDINLTTGDN